MVLSFLLPIFEEFEALGLCEWVLQQGLLAPLVISKVANFRA
jgi:hypothetical protein